MTDVKMTSCREKLSNSIHWADAHVLRPWLNDNRETLVRLSVGLGKPGRNEADKTLFESEVIRIAAEIGDFRRSTS